MVLSLLALVPVIGTMRYLDQTTRTSHSDNILMYIGKHKFSTIKSISEYFAVEPSKVTSVAKRLIRLKYISGKNGKYSVTRLGRYRIKEIAPKFM